MEAAGILHEDEHIELLDGEIFRMAAMGDPHLFCTDWLNMLLAPLWWAGLWYVCKVPSG